MDIFNLLKKEKESKRIQKLPELFYKSIVEYIRRRKNILENLDKESEEAKKLEIELKNVVSSLRDLIDVRVKKIIKLAIISAIEDIVPAELENLAPEEKILYEIINKIYSEYNKNIIQKIIEGEQPNYESFGKSIINSLSRIRGFTESKVKILRVLQEVPQFVGSDLKTYGPYGVEDIVILPKDVGEILINNNRAEEIRVKL